MPDSLARKSQRRFRHGHAFARMTMVIIVLVTALIGVGCSDSEAEGARAAARAAEESARLAEQEALRIAEAERRAIEVVLRADLDAYRRSEATRAAGASVVDARAQLVTDMQAIDTRGCPREFQVAYLKHCHAWANFQSQLVAESKTTDAHGLALLATLLTGGAWTPVMMATGAAVDNAQKSAVRLEPHEEEIRTTWQEVELIAVTRGAAIPKLNQ